MDALLFALALEVVLLQMRILVPYCRHLQETFGKLNNYHTNVNLESTTEQRAENRPENKAQKAQRHKLERDRQTLKDVIGRTLVEIVENRECSTLHEAVQVFQEHASYPVRLRLNYEYLRYSRTTIANELTMKLSQWAVELHHADQKIATIRDKMKDDLQNANARLCYVEKWLFARHESLELQLESVARAPPPRFDHENRVHTELIKAYELQIQEREQAVQHWRQRYLDDTADIEERLLKKCEQLRVAIARREELQKLFDLHTGEMRSWLTFKSERAARLAREKRIRDAAIRLQSWWRGVMVRKALGSFRYLKNLKKTPTKKKK